VQNSQSTNPTIAKLLEADAQLAAQEVELSAQIKSVQQKRQSLKTVIDMFATAPTTVTVPVATPVAEELSQQTAPDIMIPESNNVTYDITAKEPTAATPTKRQAKKNSSPAIRKQSKKSAPTKDKSKNTNDWRQYVKNDLLKMLSVRL